MASHREHEGGDDDVSKLEDDLKTVQGDSSEEAERSRQNNAADPSPAETAADVKHIEEAPHAGDSAEARDGDKNNDTLAGQEGRDAVKKPDAQTTVSDDKGSNNVEQQHTHHQPHHEREASHRTTQEQYALHHTEAKDKLILEKFTLYKTESRIYIVGSDQSNRRHRILKIDRHYSPSDAVHELSITEDEMVYNPAELKQVLSMIGDGNKTVGGLQTVLTGFFGIVGFVRFTAGWYAILIKQRAAVGLVGGHYIYHCEESLMMPISSNAKPEKPSEETRLYTAFQQVDLSKNFYFSYSYDITNTLQTNLTRPASSLDRNRAESAAHAQHWVADHAFHEPVQPDSLHPDAMVKSAWGFNDRFMWNYFLLRPAFFEKIREKKDASCWVLPLVHGFVDQAKVSVFGRTLYVTVIARRSRFFAGARFLKRGVNDEGNVANDVETEQIVHDALTTSFFDGPSDSPHGRHISPRFTSYVQHRGSIPLSWQQDTSTSSLKPPIDLHLVDPYHSAAALHFDDLFCRYGTPIIVLNLIKAREHEPREMKLIKPYEECIDYLNQFLPDAKKIKMIPFDMSAAYKNRSMDVIGVLEDIAEEVIETTKFFHSGPEPVAYSMESDAPNSSLDKSNYRSTPLLQSGVCRTNCIDCLDRTNAAQFVIAKAAFGHQLHALGVLENPHLGYECDAVHLLTELYHDHGDTIALQYGGSHLVNTMDTYRNINQWQSHSRDMVEGIKRFYANVALDQDKQNSINLFLGIDSNKDNIAGYAGQLPTGGQIPGLKEKEGDNSNGYNEKDDYSSDDDEDLPVPMRRDYRRWFTPEHLEEHPKPDDLDAEMDAVAEEYDNYWNEYYRPKLFTSFERHFAFRINTTTRYNPRMHSDRVVTDPNDLSPFKERPLALSHPPRLNAGVRRWMTANNKRSSRLSMHTKTVASGSMDGEEDPSDHEDVSLSLTTTEALATRLLSPKVSHAEAEEYASYVDQYRNLNLSNELQYEHSAGDMELYEKSVRLAKGGSAVSQLLQIDPMDEQLFVKHASKLQSERYFTG